MWTNEVAVCSCWLSKTLTSSSLSERKKEGNLRYFSSMATFTVSPSVSATSLGSELAYFSCCFSFLLKKSFSVFTFSQCSFYFVGSECVHFTPSAVTEQKKHKKKWFLTAALDNGSVYCLLKVWALLCFVVLGDWRIRPSVHRLCLLSLLPVSGLRLHRPPPKRESAGEFYLLHTDQHEASAVTKTSSNYQDLHTGCHHEL